MREVESIKNKPFTIKITDTNFALISILYLVIPVVIFFMGYLKIYLGLPFSLAILASALIYIRDLNKDFDKKSLTNNVLEIKPPAFVILVLFVVGLSLLSGIGEFTWSTIDHRVRWPILKDLIDYKWPVIYDFKNQENPVVREMLGDGSAAFAYYFTFWMVPSLFGKVFGLLTARIVLVLWSALGLFLILAGIALTEKKMVWIIPVAFLLFGGLDTIPYTIKINMGIDVSWEGWNDQMYVHGTYSQLMNVFHQCIPGWLVTLLLMRLKNNRSVGFIGSLMFCYSPWATIGILPLAICQLLRKEFLSSDKKKAVLNVFNYNNLVVPVIILITFAPFFTANPKATSVSGFIWHFVDGAGRLILAYVLYLIVEFGVWALIVYKDQKKEPLFWTLLAVMAVFPIYNISKLNDLLMRGTMAPMFILMVMVIHRLILTLDKNAPKSDIKLLVLLVFFISALTQFNLLTASVNFSITEPNQEGIKTQIGSFGNINDETETEMVDLQFFVEDYENSIFFKYLAK